MAWDEAGYVFSTIDPAGGAAMWSGAEIDTPNAEVQEQQLACPSASAVRGGRWQRKHLDLHEPYSRTR